MDPLLLSLLWRRLTRPISLLRLFGWPLSGQVYNLALPDHDEQFFWMNGADRELSDRIISGHVTKSNLCKSCLEAEVPGRIHRSICDVDKATHVLHIDIAKPLTSSEDGFTYQQIFPLRTKNWRN